MKKDIVITYVRVMATIFIFLCHALTFSQNFIIKSSVYFFNVGVYIFFFISGYLFKNKNISEKYSINKWLKKNYLKLNTPILILVAFVSIFNIIRGNKIYLQQIICYVFNLEIILPSIYGIHHLWFLSIIWICYVLVYVINIVERKKILSTVNLKNIMFLILTFLIVIFIYLKKGDYISYCTNVYVFLIGYYYKGNRFKSKVIYVFIIAFSLGIRLILKTLIDGSMSYYLSVGILQTIISISMYNLLRLNEKFLYVINKNDIVNRSINWLEKYSYFIYIGHYIFLYGILKIISITKYLWLNIILVFVLTLILAFYLEKLSTLVNNFFKERLE